MGFANLVKSLVSASQRASFQAALLARQAAGNLYQRYGTIEVYPQYAYDRQDLYGLAEASDVLRITHRALIQEIFRKGLEITKVEDAGDDHLPNPPALVQSPNSAEAVLQKLKNVNLNGQDILDVGRMLELDLDVVDDAYVLFRKDYAFNDAGNILWDETKLVEIVRANPLMMGLVMNNADEPGIDNDGNRMTFCPIHRQDRIPNQDYCPQCGRQTLSAHFVYSGPQGKTFYAPEEMIHFSKFWPNLRHGHSPILSVWMKVRTLLFMDKYLMQLYDGQRAPKGLLLFKTMNPDKLEVQLDKARARLQQDPNFPLTLSVPNNDNGKEFAQFIDLMRSLQDLQHTDVRNEFRRQVGAVYQVEPIFQSDTSTSGGLNNEGIQITVTNRAVEEGQNVFNRKFFPRVLEELGINGWSVKLAPSEEQDEGARLQRQSVALQNAQLASQLGLRVSWDKKTNEAVIEDGEVEKPTPQSPFGSLGGFGGSDDEKPTPSFEPKSGSPAKPSSASASDDATAPSGKPMGKGSESVAPVGKASPTEWTPLGRKLKKLIQDYVETYLAAASDDEVRAAIGNLKKQMMLQLEAAVREQQEKVYREQMEVVGRELDRNLTFGAVDENAIRLLASQPVLYESYAGLSDDLIEQVNEAIKLHYANGELAVKPMTEAIRNLTGLLDSRAENIARTETGKVSAAARKVSYQKDPRFSEFKFRHAGPNDHRTTPTCERIIQRTKDGVSWNDYVRIVAEESSVDFPDWSVDPDAPLAHYQCRHVPLRIVR